MKEAIEQIKERLHKYPDVRYEATASSISVLPTSNDGFTVRLDINQSQYTVSFNGWHENFQREEEALDCFAFGLSDECRLKEHRRGNFAYRWTVEYKQNGNWVADSATSLFIFQFWKPKRICYLQNNLITLENKPDS